MHASTFFFVYLSLHSEGRAFLEHQHSSDASTQPHVSTLLSYLPGFIVYQSTRLNISILAFSLLSHQTKYFHFSHFAAILVQAEL
jgi:hypothetical protein